MRQHQFGVISHDCMTLHVPCYAMIKQTIAVIRCIQLVPYLLDIGEVQFGKHWLYLDQPDVMNIVLILIAALLHLFFLNTDATARGTGRDSSNFQS